MKKYKYFQFPLIMLRETHKDFDKAMQDIINYGSVDFALKQDIDIYDATRELLYSYYRDRNNSYEPAMQALDQLFNNDVLEINEESAIFDGSGEVNEEAIYEAFEVVKSDYELRKLAVLNKQLRNIDSFFNIKGVTANSRYSQYGTLHKIIKTHEAKHGTDPRPTIGTELFWDLYKNDKDPVLFAAYLAIRSVEGHNKYAATNRPAIAGRMAGAKSPKVLESITGDGRKVFEKYSHRYHFGKLLTRLYSRGLIKSMLSQKNWTYIYISTKLTPLELGEAIARQADKRNLKDSINDARKAYQKITASL